MFFYMNELLILKVFNTQILVSKPLQMHQHQ